MGRTAVPFGWSRLILLLRFLQSAIAAVALQAEVLAYRVQELFCALLGFWVLREEFLVITITSA